ncbi:DUF1499 domain-containing protein [Cardiobacterium sp. AH-315-I02]|nr:DUF1499 domain-containing protein [Cardiobacterium sp. AH-315-I02]
MVFVIILLVTIIFGTLFKNGANLFDDPGISERLRIFLTTNTAITADNHKLKELRTPEFDVTVEVLYQRVLAAAVELGWVIFAHDTEKKHTNFVVYSPVFLFKDKIYVQVKNIDESRSSLYIHSASHTGRADFASNSGNIQALVKKLRKDK